MTKVHIFAPSSNQYRTNTELMQEEVQEVVTEVKVKLAKVGNYSDVAKASGGAVSLSQVKKVFALKDTPFEVIETVVKYSWAVIRKAEKRVKNLRKYSSAA